MGKMIRCWFRSVAISAIFLQCATPSTAQVNVGDPVFTEECYANIVEANADNNEELSQNEYVTFAQLQGPPGLIDDVELFPELPLEYRAVFNTLACLCSDPAFGGDSSDVQCCVVNQTIRVPGPPGNGQSDEDLRMLFAICALTDSAAREVANTDPPSPTAPPIPAPTPSPTGTPTFGPTTATPTAVPTTRSPTSSPTSPTLVPTTETPTTQTESPTLTPNSPAPTTPPSQLPTANPTFSPAPTLSPTTGSPTTLPTTGPTQTPLDIATVVDYTVAFQDGQTSPDLAPYYSDLVVAMDILSEEVVKDIWGRRRQRQRRGLQETLQVQATKPTRIISRSNVTCSPEFTNTDDLCQDIRSEVILRVFGDVDEFEARREFESELFNAIYDGDLQDQLDVIGAEITVLTGLDDPDREASSGDTLSSGAIGGIVAAALFGVTLPLCVFLYTRSRSSYEAQLKSEAMYHQQEVAEVGDKPDDLEPKSVDSVYTDAAIRSTTSAARDVGALGSGTLGASQPDYGRASRKAMEAMEAGEDIVAEPELDVQPDSSSNAGSSGWSSSAGLSSYNTGSLDDSTDAAAAAGATLAALGVGSNLSRKLESDRKKDGTSAPMPSGGGKVTREQLDHLIEAGDWAAVGATAALLAAASDSQSQTSRSGAGSASGSNASGSFDAARAAELDNLVEAGDWEGVVLAAARFEASDTVGSRGSRSARSADSSSATDSATGGATGSSPSVHSESLTTSDDPSKVKKRAEMREEVEALVRRVVPEEIDNVDEMMNQFKGREEELVETLRTMQERAVAQKARAAGHRAAKAEARKNVKRGAVPSAAGAKAVETSQASESAASAPDTPTSQGTSSVSSTGSGSGSHQEVRTALEQAIESGDWDAVGQAAALMSDASTVSSGEIDRIANLSQSSGGTGSRESSGALNASRAAELDAMIDRGDWSGVVAAAERFSRSDRNKAGRSGRTKEEEEALAQAEKWAKIAQQNKPGATDAAASDAAEWAIQRSLSQMKKADKDKATGPSNQDEDEV